MTVGRSLLAIALLLSSACDFRDKASTENEAVKVANAHLVKLAPGIRLHTLKVDAIDMQDRWRLQYNAREPGTGGPIIVVVNKHTGEVVHMETEQ